MNKKTYFYIALSLCILSFYLYLNGYRLSAKSIYKERALAYMSETYSVVIETDDYAIVEFEGVTELIDFKNGKNSKNKILPSLDSILTKEQDYNDISLTYPIRKFNLTNSYTTAYQILDINDRKLNTLYYRFDYLQHDDGTFEEKIGYIYVDNTSGQELSFDIWNMQDDTYTPLIYSTKQLDSGAKLLYSDQVVTHQSQLITYLNGEIYNPDNEEYSLKSAHYKGVRIESDLLKHLETFQSIPDSYDPELIDETFEDDTPILSILEIITSNDGSTYDIEYDYYEYNSKIVLRRSSVNYIVSTSYFNNLISKIKPTQ